MAGFDLARQPDAVRAAIGVTGQFSAELPDCTELPAALARLVAPVVRDH